MTTALAEERDLLELARTAVGQYLRTHPGMRFHYDDLLSDACFGVASAAARHDETAGASLRTFAYRRASGAIIDGIRDRSPLTRGEFATAADPTALALQRAPLPLEQLTEAAGWEPSHVDREPDQLDDREVVQQLIAACTPIERFVLVTVVMYGFPAHAIAAELGVTDSAVAQYKTKGLARLRAHLANPHAAPARRSGRTLTELPMTTTSDRIADLLQQGYSVDLTAEAGASAGWTRQDIDRVIADRGWTLDASGRLPRPARVAPRPPAVMRPGRVLPEQPLPQARTQPVPAPTRQEPPVDTVKERIAAGLRSAHTPIRKAAAKANDALAALDRLTADWESKELARQRVAQLERELADAKAKLRGSTPKPTGAAPAGAGEHSQARAWALQQGITVPAKGRVPESVLVQWRSSVAGSAA